MFGCLRAWLVAGFRLIDDRQYGWIIDLVKGSVLLVGAQAHYSRLLGEHHRWILRLTHLPEPAAVRFHKGRREK